MLSFLCSLIAACGENNVDVIENEVSTNLIGVTEPKEVEVYFTPNPLEVASVLYNSNFDYNPELIKNELRPDPITSYHKANELGMLVVDAGYCGLGGDKLAVKEKVKEIKILAEDLNLKDVVTQSHLDRFEQNQNEKDSISALVLELYDNALSYLKKNNKEELALSILTGVLIEGQYLLSKNLNYDNSKMYFSILYRQQEYAESMQILLSRFVDSEAAKENITLINRSKSSFEKFDTWLSNPTDSTTTFDQHKIRLVNELESIRSQS